jgi:hypothetical protein
MTAISMRDAEKIVVSMYQADEPLMLLGKPGIGKTAMFERIARELGIGFIDFRLTLKDQVEVGGMRIPDSKTGLLKHYPPDDLPHVSIHGPKGIILFDEINVPGQLMQAATYGIILERRNGSYKMAEGWVPMASGNNVTDKAAAQRLSSALANRFNVQIVEPDLKSWLDQYGSQNVDTRGTSFLRFRPELFHVMPGEPIRLPGETSEEASRKAKERSNEIPFPTARSWTKSFKFIDETPTLRRKIFTGYVGQYPAEEFEAFWRIMENAPSFDEVVRDPEGVRVPSETDPGTCYAVAGMLARLVDRKTMGPVVTYVERMRPRDYAVATIVDAVRRNPELQTTKGYATWAAHNQDIVL